MSLSDIAAVILLEHQKFTDLEKAKEAVKITFKNDFPYWSFSEWNVEVPLMVGKKILRQYKNNSPVTISQLIVDLPSLANESTS
jgi:hypothetical protein